MQTRDRSLAASGQDREGMIQNSHHMLGLDGRSVGDFPVSRRAGIEGNPDRLGCPCRRRFGHSGGYLGERAIEPGPQFRRDVHREAVAIYLVENRRTEPGEDE